MNHMIQYALVGHLSKFAGHTESKSDEEIIASKPMLFSKGDRVERFDRCPVCETFTRTKGVLRNINCPAVMKAKSDLINDANYPPEEKDDGSHP